MASTSAQFPVHRTGGGPVLAWVWIGAMVVLAFLALRAGRSLPELGGALLVLSTIGPAYVWGLRPRLEENPDGLLVVNPLRDVRVPWPALSYARVGYVLRLWTVDGQEVSVFAVPRETSAQRLRRRSPLNLPFSAAPPVPDPDPRAAGMSAAERVAYDLNERVERDPPVPGAPPMVSTWSAVALRTLAATAAAAAAGVLLMVA